MGGPVAAALERWAATAPEKPFLFYRNAKGHFRWWSFATAWAFLDHGGFTFEKPSVGGVVVELEAAELLGSFLRAACAGATSAVELPDLERGAGRDVWISWRPLTDAAELALARWAITSGAAILLEPGPALHPELFAWARPTVVSGTAEELCGLADQLDSLAPRFLRRRWFRQRGERLRLLLVSGPAVAQGLAPVEARWRELSPFFAPRVAPISLGTLV